MPDIGANRQINAPGIAAGTSGTNVSAALTASGLADEPGSVTANNVTINTRGDDNAMGAIAVLNDTITLNGGTITTTGNWISSPPSPTDNPVERQPGHTFQVS
ncbi:hypothetical protein [Pseudomonas azerbaijanoccidentalis]